jgi:hypothetical protein
MRLPWKIATALFLGMLVSRAPAAQPKVAVFEFELVDTSLEGATYGNGALTMAIAKTSAHSDRSHSCQRGR